MLRQGRRLKNVIGSPRFSLDAYGTNEELGSFVLDERAPSLGGERHGAFQESRIRFDE